MEGALGLFTPSVDSYAGVVLPLLLSDDLPLHSGAIYGQKGTPILPSKPFSHDAHLANTVYHACEALLKSKAGI